MDLITTFQSRTLSPLRSFDADVKVLGPKHAAQKALEHLRVRVITSFAQGVEAVLQTAPVVIVANPDHYLLDPPLLFSTLPNRTDLFLIAAHNRILANHLPNFAQHTIGVHIYHHLAGRRFSPLRPFLNLVRHLPFYSPEEEHQLNIASIARASEGVSRGAVVIIFPGVGSDSSNAGRWFKGVGHLLRNVRTRQAAYVVRANIKTKGNFLLDFVRFIPLINRLLPTLHRTYSAPKEIGQIVRRNHANPGHITAALEVSYKSWVAELRAKIEETVPEMLCRKHAIIAE